MHPAKIIRENHTSGYRRETRSSTLQSLWNNRLITTVAKALPIVASVYLTYQIYPWISTTFLGSGGQGFLSLDGLKRVIVVSTLQAINSRITHKLASTVQRLFSFASHTSPATNDHDDEPSVSSSSLTQRSIISFVENKLAELPPSTPQPPATPQPVMTQAQMRIHNHYIMSHWSTNALHHKGLQSPEVLDDRYRIG